MSDRDELARVIAIANKRATSPIALRDDDAADVLWSAGWRKKPSRDDLIVQIALFWAGRHSLETATDAVLALLDGPTETGEK